ncbi:MAG: SDR family NAD(P)-dependent oxidoreductase [Actinomycetota bacterium]
MANLSGKNILVVGGSGALGSLIAKELVAAGATVMATSSSIDSAERIPSIANPRMVCDLSSNDSIQVLVDYLLDSGVEIDGLVNAAGVVAFGNVSDLKVETLDRLFAIDATGPMRLIMGLLPALTSSSKAGREPFIVNISGIVAESPMASLAAYSAAKSALYAFDQAITRELRRDGIRVLDARPSHTETGLATRAIAGVAPSFPTGMEPSWVAARIVKAILEDERDLPSGSFQQG